MIDNTTDVAAAAPSSASATEDVEFDFLWNVGEFRDSVAALGMALSAAQRTMTSTGDPHAGLRSALILLRGTTDEVMERATKLEQAGRALLSAKAIG